MELSDQGSAYKLETHKVCNNYLLVSYMKSLSSANHKSMQGMNRIKTVMDIEIIKDNPCSTHEPNTEPAALVPQ